MDFGQITNNLIDTWNSLDADLQINLIYLFALIAFMIVGYLVYIIVNPVLDKRKKLSFVKVTFPSINDSETALSSINEVFLALHKLNARISLELHKVGKRVELIIVSPQGKSFETIKKVISSVDGTQIELLNNSYDPLSKYSNAFIDRLYLTKDFNTINLENTLTYSQIVKYMASVEDGESASFILHIRPAKSKVSRIKELCHKLEKRENFTLIDKKQIDNLMLKSQNLIYLSNIYIAASKPHIKDGIKSILYGLGGENTFSSKKVKDVKNLQSRYIPFENIFTPWFRKKFGSYLNTEELSRIIHPTNVERGNFNVSETRIVEAAPDFLEEKEDNIEIGESLTVSGEKRKVYLPLQNFDRHIYLAGATGMGKSTVMINVFLELAKKKKDSALLMFDPHGEDLLEIASRIDNWDNLVYFNLAESEKIFTFNPLFSFKESLKDKDNRAEMILSIIGEEASRRSKDLGTSIERILKFLIQTAIHFPDAYYQWLTSNGLDENKAAEIVYERQITFSDLSYILDETSGYVEVLKEIFYEYKENIGLKWKNQLDKYQVSRMIIDGVENRLGFVVQDSLVDIFEGTSFDINEIIEEKKRLLMPISEQSFGKISKKLITKFLLNEIWSGTQSKTHKEERNEAVIFIDEFQEAQIEIIDDLLSQARKYKVRLVFGNQFLGQLWENIRKSVLGNVSTLFSFKVQNLEEAETITPMFKKKIQPEDILSLPKYHAYLRTLNSYGKDDVAFMSFKTVNYEDKHEEKFSKKDIQNLNEKSLEMYGEDRQKVKERRLRKHENPNDFFLNIT